MANEYPTFLYSYPYKGAQWTFELKAKDFDEAEERLKALAWAKLDGELVARIYVPAPWRLLQRLVAWARGVRANPR